MRIGMRIVIRIDVRIDMCIGMCIGMLIDMCMEMRGRWVDSMDHRQQTAESLNGDMGVHSG